MKRVMKDARLLFSGWGMFLTLSFLFVLNFIYFYLVSKQIIASLIVGVFGAIFLFITFVIKNKKIKKYQNQLDDLQKYTTNMTFFLKTGKSVGHALRASKESVNKDIQKSIQNSIDYLEEKGKLNTTHFEKYYFPALNQFHRILKIKFEKGGKVEDMFNPVNQSILFEIMKRDELYRKKRGMAVQVYTLMGLVLLMPLLMSLVVPNLWSIFLEFKITSVAVLVGTYLALLLNLRLLENQKNNISIQI